MIVLQILASGILLGSIYALISVGLDNFGVIKIVNMAHGEFLMIGMYAAYFIYTATQINVGLISIIIFPLMMVLGYIIYRLVIKPLLGTAETETNTILATSGLTFVLQNLALMLWTADYRAIKTPTSSQSFSLGKIMLSVDRTYAFFNLFGFSHSFILYSNANSLWC